MESSHRAVRPLTPLAPYVGGKRQLAADVIQRISKIRHTTYCEPFVGMGGVFLRRPERPAAEVINDLNRDVADFFRVLRHHYQAFMDLLKWQLTSRAEFDRLVATDPTTLTDMNRAARFLYLQRTSFGGKVISRTFGVSPTAKGRFDVNRLAPLLEAVHERLSDVTIECLPWDVFIRRYDRPGTLFYLDPPYWGTERYYGPGMWSRETFNELAELLAGIEGKFILSLNDTPGVRKVFRAFKMAKVTCSHTAGGGALAKPVAELLIQGP